MRAKGPWQPSLLVVGLALSALPTARAEGKPIAKQTRELPSPSAISGPLPAEGTESRIRALAGSTRPAAAMKLAELSRSAEVTGNARTLLLAVRALAGLAQHEAAQKALLLHLREPSPGDEPSRRAFIRAVAALALSATPSPEGVRALVLLASGPDDADAELRELSRTALAAHPPSQDTLRQALPWLDDSARRARLAWLTEQRTVRQRERATACSEARSRLAELPKLTTAAAAAVLAALSGCTPEAAPSREEWRRLARSSPTWTLRGLVAVGIGAEDREWHRLAQAELERGDRIARSAAAWFLATTSLDSAERLARDGRAEVRAAAQNQLLLDASRPNPHCAAGAQRTSTSALYRQFLESPPQGSDNTLGCLASRLRAQPGPGLTGAELESLLQTSPALTRLLVAVGLGHAEAPTRERARGLLARSYALETDALVRRAQCGALVQLGLGARERLRREMAALDPDPVCRALGAGAPWSSPGHPLLSTTTAEVELVAVRVLADPVSLTPAPDGFVGARVPAVPARVAFDGNFVDCQESGEPAWACGRPAPEPP